MKNLFDSLIGATKNTKIDFFSIYHHSVFLQAKNVGLASTIHTELHTPLEGAGTFHEKNTKELASLIKSNNYLETSIGLAAINSEVNHQELLKIGSNINGFALLEEKGQNKNIAVLGNFPNIKKLQENKSFKILWIFEINPPDDSFKTPKDYAEYLPRADVVLFTAVTLINHTIFDFYPYLKNSFKILTGPSVPLHHSLFDFGIDAICGSVVTNPELAKLSLSQGASYKYAKGIERITLLRNNHAK